MCNVYAALIACGPYQTTASANAPVVADPGINHRRSDSEGIGMEDKFSSPLSRLCAVS